MFKRLALISVIPCSGILPPLLYLNSSLENSILSYDWKHLKGTEESLPTTKSVVFIQKRKRKKSVCDASLFH